MAKELALLAKTQTLMSGKRKARLEQPVPPGTPFIEPGLHSPSRRTTQEGFELLW
jgi:hypothetical protein